MFLKKLLAVSVSNLAYLRGLFNESAFGDRMLEDISLKILKDKSGHEGACTLIGWVKACFEVIKFLFALNNLINIHKPYSHHAIE